MSAEEEPTVNNNTVDGCVIDAATVRKFKTELLDTFNFMMQRQKRMKKQVKKVEKIEEQQKLLRRVVPPTVLKPTGLAESGRLLEYPRTKVASKVWGPMTAAAKDKLMDEERRKASPRMPRLQLSPSMEDFLREGLFGPRKASKEQEEKEEESETESQILARLDGDLSKALPAGVHNWNWGELFKKTGENHMLPSYWLKLLMEKEEKEAKKRAKSLAKLGDTRTSQSSSADSEVWRQRKKDEKIFKSWKKPAFERKTHKTALFTEFFKPKHGTWRVRSDADVDTSEMVMIEPPWLNEIVLSDLDKKDEEYRLDKREIHRLRREMAANNRKRINKAKAQERDRLAGRVVDDEENAAPKKDAPAAPEPQVIVKQIRECENTLLEMEAAMRNSGRDWLRNGIKANKSQSKF